MTGLLLLKYRAVTDLFFLLVNNLRINDQWICDQMYSPISNDKYEIYIVHY